MAKAHAAAIQNRPVLRLFRLQPAVHGGYQRLAPTAQQAGQQHPRHGPYARKVVQDDNQRDQPVHSPYSGGSASSTKASKTSTAAFASTRAGWTRIPIMRRASTARRVNTSARPRKDA